MIKRPRWPAIFSRPDAIAQAPAPDPTSVPTWRRLQLDKLYAGLLIFLLMRAIPVGGQDATSVAPPGQGKGAGPRFGPITRVELTITNRGDFQRLVQGGYDVAGGKSNRVFLYADQDEMTALRVEGWSLQILASPPSAVEAASKSPGAYHDYTAMTAWLDARATNYPAICRKISLGKSVRNRDLWALKITSNPDLEQDKPEFRYVSTIHGNEPLGTEMCLYFIDELLEGYARQDARIVNLVDNVEIWIVPLMNPDGRESNPPSRYNANGYDLNRSFPEGSATDFGNRLYGPLLNTNGLQPEVRHLMTWSAGHSFITGAHFHTGTLVVNYPYDNDNMGSVFSPTPDEPLFQAMSRAYASNNPPMWNHNDFTQHFTNGIVNGADWYAVSGGLQDWSYRYNGSSEVTIELSDEGAYGGQWPDPPASRLPAYWGQNRESMLAYLEGSLTGVRGLLRDAQTGRPVPGTLRVEGLHHLVFSNPSVGDYHRLLLPGIYTLWFYAPGYEAQRIPNVTVESGAATRVDVALRPGSPRFAAKINFQPAGAAIPTGFLADSGSVFGLRSGGFNYGWEATLANGNPVERKAGRSQDLRYDTFCQMQAGGNQAWEIAVPNGPYSVLLAAGDPLTKTGLYRCLVENVLLIDGATSASNPWIEGLGTVVVTDGRLTLSNGAGAVGNKLAFIEISALEPATIEQWRAYFFATTEDTGSAASTADPDQDGIPNLLEYAFGLEPNQADIAAPLRPRVVQENGADQFACVFPRNTNATDLTFTVQVCEDLTAHQWSNLASYKPAVGWSGPGQVTETQAGLNCVQVTVLAAPSIGNFTQRFVRLQVVHP